jgi:hypothetical protein
VEQTDIYPLLDIANLIFRKLQCSLLPEDELALSAWLAKSSDNEMLYRELTLATFPESELDSLPVPTTQRAVAKVYDAIRFEKQVRVVNIQSRLYKLVSAAAMIAAYW